MSRHYGCKSRSYLKSLKQVYSILSVSFRVIQRKCDLFYLGQGIRVPPIHFVKYFVVKFFAFSVLTRDLVHNFLINFLGRSYHQFLSKSTDCIFSGQVLFKKWANPGLFCRFIFCFFKQTSLQFLQQIHVKKCPSSIRCQDSNPQPLEHESPPITSRSGLQPSGQVYINSMIVNN